jgi:tetratricopeptide (TPR) repeat protein
MCAGHVYTAVGDYPNALASHKQCVQLVKQMGDRLQEAREIGNVGAVYLAMGEFESAVDCHTQHLRLARRLGNQVLDTRASDDVFTVSKECLVTTESTNDIEI